MRNRRVRKYRRGRPQTAQAAKHFDESIPARDHRSPFSGRHTPIDLIRREPRINGLSSKDDATLLARQVEDGGMWVHSVNLSWTCDTFDRRILWAVDRTHSGVEPWVRGSREGYRLGA